MLGRLLNRNRKPDRKSRGGAKSSIRGLSAKERQAKQRKREKAANKVRASAKQRSELPPLQDYRLLYLATGLFGFGLLMIFSSSAIISFSEAGNSFVYFIRQIIWLVLGIIVAYISYRVPLKLISKLSPLLMAVAIILLIAVFFIGDDINGAQRWIFIGSFSLQPSEVAKLSFVIYLSAWLSKPRPKVSDFRDAIKNHLTNELLPFVLLIGIVSSLIILQPDLDTAVIIAVTALTVYFASGKDAIHTLGSFFIVLTMGLVGILAAVAAPYRLDRLQTYFEFWRTGDVQDKLDTGFQVWNNLVAIGTGGFLGVGFGNSRQKLFYLQNAAFTDSIFSIVAEEFGLIGSVLLILVFLYFMSLGVEIARKAPDQFSALLALGITTWIVLQAFLNIGANLALIPFGGIPLPFVSYGGSSTLVTMAGIGLLLNIQRRSQSKRG